MNPLPDHLGFLSKSTPASSHFEALSLKDLHKESELLNNVFSEICGTPGEVFFSDIGDISLLGKIVLLDLSTYCETKQCTPNELKQRCDEGMIGIFHYEEKQGEEKPTLRAFSELKPAFDADQVELHRRNEKGRTTVTILEPNQYIVNTFTPEQRARIAQIAFAALNASSKSFESLSDSDEKNKPIRKATIQMEETKYEIIKDKFPNMKSIQAEQKENDRQSQQLKQTENAAQEKKAEEEKVQHLDKKAGKKRKFHQIQDEKREVIKLEQKNRNKMESS